MKNMERGPEGDEQNNSPDGFQIEFEAQVENIELTKEQIEARYEERINKLNEFVKLNFGKKGNPEAGMPDNDGKWYCERKAYLAQKYIDYAESSNREIDLPDLDKKAIALEKKRLEIEEERKDALEKINGPEEKESGVKSFEDELGEI